MLKNDNVHKIQPSFQSPVKISVVRARGGAGGVGAARPRVPETFPAPVHVLGTPAPSGPKKDRSGGEGLLPDLVKRVRRLPCWPAACPLPRFQRCISRNLLLKEMVYEESISEAS